MTEPIPADDPLSTPALPLEINGADRQFSIKRMRSEAGYFYWILEGHGKHKCFVRCDTWEDAVEQAKRRLASENDELLFANGL